MTGDDRSQTLEEHPTADPVAPPGASAPHTSSTGVLLLTLADLAARRLEGVLRGWARERAAAPGGRPPG